MKVKYLIDTDWVIHYLNGHGAIVRRLHEVAAQGLGISIVTLAELYEGVYYSRDPEANEVSLNAFLHGVSVVGIDEETSRLFGKERGRLRAAKKQVGDFDLMIGVTARQHNLTLFTNNRRHFTLIEGVMLELKCTPFLGQGNKLRLLRLWRGGGEHGAATATDGAI